MEMPAPVDSDQTRINRLNDLQIKVQEIISRELGSAFLANLVAGKPEGFVLNPVELTGSGAFEKEKYDSYSRRGTSLIDNSTWYTEASHSLDGKQWNIKTFFGQKQHLYATPGYRGKICVDSTLSIENLRRIVLERAISGKITGAESEVLLQGLGILFVKEKDLQEQQEDPKFQILIDALFTPDSKTSDINLHLPI